MSSDAVNSVGSSSCNHMSKSSVASASPKLDAMKTTSQDSTEPSSVTTDQTNEATQPTTNANGDSIGNLLNTTA